MKKRIKTEELMSFDIDQFNGSLDRLIEWLESLEDEFNEYSNLRIDSYRFYDEVEIRLVGERLETDEEFEKRKKRAEKAKETREKRRKKEEEKREKEERKQLERLLKKYPDVVNN